VPRLPDGLREQAARLGQRLPPPVYRGLRPLYAKVAGLAGAPAAPSSLPSTDVAWPAIPPRRTLGPYPQQVAPPALRDEPRRLWPRPAPAGYLGQLEPAFQADLGARTRDLALDECLFYHWTRLADGRVLQGFWDLLGGEEEYLGGVPLRGRRVLELGPASGWLTTWMDQQGADVVGFDIGWELTQDLMPLPGLDVARLGADFLARACLAQNAWWYLHHDHGLRARAVYGDIYALPEDLGRFDVAVFAAILLHLRDPFRALEQAARRTDGTMIVVEPLSGDLVAHDGFVRWNPTGGLNPSGWWHHSPSAIVSMLRLLGFERTTVTYHHQPYNDEDAGGTPEDVPFFTVVAHR
jgi:O-methyltransferase